MITDGLILGADGWTLAPKAELTISGYTPDATNVVSTAGMAVNTTQAMRLAAVYACVRLISQTVASLPFRVFKRGNNGRTIAVDHWLDTIINRRTNAHSIAAIFWGSVIAAVLLRGGSYVRKQYVGKNIVGLKFLNPDYLSIQRGVNGSREYWYGENGLRSKIPTNELIYFPGFSIDGECGISSIEYGAGVFGNAMAANAAANDNFVNGLQPTTYIKNPTVIKEDQKEKFRSAMAKVAGALNSGKTVVLEGGQEIGTISIDPRMAQLLESRQFSVEQICTWFGVAPHMIGHSNISTWGSGLEQQTQGFVTFTCGPIMTVIAQVINVFVLNNDPLYYAEHVTQGLMRADSAARAAYYSTMVNNGLMTRDEVREIENLPTKGGNADALTVQTALTPIDKLGVTNNAL